MANGGFVEPEDLNWERAYKRVLKNSHSDFVPLRYDFWLLQQNPNAFIAKAKEKLSQEHYNPAPLKIIEVPKPDLTTRPAAIAELDDRIIYQSLVDSIAEIVEPQIETCVYSHRLTDDYDSEQMYRDYDKTYGAFLNEQKKICESREYDFVVAADVASYYERIYHHRLVQLLDGMGCDVYLRNTLGHLLREWNNGDSHGIPQGFWASDYLGNIYLHQVDRYMLMRGYKYVRYVDDMIVFCNSYNEGRVVLLELGKQLRKLGVGLNAAKTKIYPVGNYLQKVKTATERVRNVFDEMLEGEVLFNPYFDEFDERDIAELKNQINKVAVHKVFVETIKPRQVDETILKACLKLLSAAKDPFAINYVLDNLSVYPHLSSYFGNYLCKCPFEAATKERILSYLQSQGNIYDWQTMWLIRYFLINGFCIRTRKILRGIYENRNNDDALRALTAFILGYKGDHTDQCLIKDSYDSENSSMIKRGIVCGLIPMPKAERNYFLKYHKHDSWIMKIACETVEKR